MKCKLAHDFLARAVVGLTLNQASKFFLDRGHSLSSQVTAILPQPSVIGDCHITSGFRRAPLAARRPASRCSVAHALEMHSIERPQTAKTTRSRFRKAAAHWLPGGPYTRWKLRPFTAHTHNGHRLQERARQSGVSQGNYKSTAAFAVLVHQRRARRISS